MDLQNQKRNLEKVTDYVEEKEIDRSKVQNLDLKEEDEVDSELDKQQANELAKVSISKEDVELIVNELEVSEAEAEKSLRLHNGQVVAALRSFLVWNEEMEMDLSLKWRKAPMDVTVVSSEGKERRKKWKGGKS